MTKRKRTTKKKIQQRRIRFLALIVFVALVCLSVFFFLRRGKNVEKKIDNISLVRGVDISRYQGDVDFNNVYDQSIRFAFIKSTEGVEFIDSSFHENWRKAKDSKLKIGAYHFFLFSESGLAQAEHFISNVDLDKEDFGPVIDLEYYGSYIHNPAPVDDVKKELRLMIDRFKEKYNKKTIIYCNNYIYDRYLKNDFSDVDIWYRSIGREYPTISDGRKWVFWQYDDKAKLEGYGGPGANEFIDLNYFRGDMKDLEDYGRNNS